MSVIKCTMIFKQSTGDTENDLAGRVAGWTEQYYLPGETAAPRTAFRDLMVERAKLLPSKAQIQYGRMQFLDPKGASNPLTELFKGNQAYKQDVPSLGLLIRSSSANTDNSRTLILRSWPDADIVNGELLSQSAANLRVRPFMLQLKNGGWMFKGRKLDNAQIGVLTVSPAGVVTMAAPGLAGVAVGLKVQIIRANVINQLRRVQRGGIFQVIDKVSDSVFTLAGWKGGSCILGTARLAQVVYPNYTALAWNAERITSRKVGRPSDLYLGKRPTRV